MHLRQGTLSDRKTTLSTSGLLCALGALLALLSNPQAAAPAPANLVTDASFESRLPSWFLENQKGYCLARIRSASAADGEGVMVIKGWHDGACRILSPAISVLPRRLSATCHVRHRGEAGKVTVELLVVEEDGRTVVESCGRWRGDGTGRWHRLVKEDMRLGDVFTGMLEEKGEPAGARTFVNHVPWPAGLAGARRVADTDEPIMEIVRYDKPGSAVLIIIDHDARPKEEVILRVPDCGDFHFARTATGNPLEFALEEGTAVLRLPLETCEAVVLSEEETGR